MVRLLAGRLEPGAEQEAALATRGEYWKTGTKIARQRRSTRDILPNESFYGGDED